MDERTLTALKGSIAKWEDIVAGVIADDGANNCPLCRLFHWQYGGKGAAERCDGCPVKAATGNPACVGSPYDDYEENGERIEDAEAELEFLRGLLPAEVEAVTSQDSRK